MDILPFSKKKEKIYQTSVTQFFFCFLILCITFQGELHILFYEVKHLASTYSAHFENPICYYLDINFVAFTSAGVSYCVAS